MFGRVAIVGVGLIGGSFALALRRAGAAREIVGVGRTHATLDRAVELGIVDRATSNVADALQACDLVLIAAPVAQTESILESLAPHLAPSTIVSDAGSTKCDVIAAARRALGTKVAQFVPGHPIAGREVNGPDAALADLYDGKRVLLTPLPENDAATVATVRAAWEACGARVDCIAPERHDAVLAAVSHLPHVLAYVLVAQIAEAADSALKFDLAGGGFRDFTRIAASSPEMWRDIALANRDALLSELDDYRARLDSLSAAIAACDGVALETLFRLASQARLNWKAGA